MESEETLSLEHPSTTDFRVQSSESEMSAAEYQDNSASRLRVPALDLIRIFVVVGRRMSITLAAKDLCLTQPAISRQIKKLEDQLGVRLFIRGHRAISFTPEGRKLFDIGDALVVEFQNLVGAIKTSDYRVIRTGLFA